MNIFNDINNFFSFLSFVDIVFLVAVVVLLILIVALIYFVKINKEIFGEDDFFKDDNINKADKDENINNIVESLPEQTKPVTEEYNDEDGELLDLKTLTEKLKNENEEDRISFTEYEKDQEEKAIISYDELLNKKNKYAINYEKEEMIDDLLVKKIDLNNFENSKSEEELYEEARVISYQKEEDFLKALKELNNLLN